MVILERISDPDAEPLGIDEVKAHLRLHASITAHDLRLLALIQGAREWAEDFTGRAMVDQTWRQTHTDYEEGDIPLLRSPVLEVTRFVSVDGDGVETELLDVGSPLTWNGELMEPDSKWPRLTPYSGTAWTAGMLRIEYRAGWLEPDISPTIDRIPETFKTAMLLHIEAMYDRDPERMEKLLDVARMLLRTERAALQMA